MPGDDQEKTEKATPKRREEARKKGQVPTSRDVSSAALILLVVLVFKGFGSNLFSNVKETMISTFSSLSMAPMTELTFYSLMQNRMFNLFFMLAPIIGLMTFVGIVSVVLQHGILWTVEPLMPQFSRISPLSGFKRIFSIGAFVNLGKTFLKFLVIGFVSYLIIIQEIPAVVSMNQLAEKDILSVIGKPVARLILWVGFVVAILGGVDFGYQLWENERKLRMSRQEIKEEMKQAEGTPLVRSRLRALQREMASKRMMADVPKADVVVTNPTHLAVAISYQSEEMDAPKVIAKGAGFIAQKIRAIAEEHGIPIVENKPVARSLFKKVEIGHEIPSGIYRAVAEILAYVYKLRGHKKGNS